MERKVTKKSVSRTKGSTIDAGRLDPFAEIVDPPATKKQAVKAVKVGYKEVKKQVKRTAKMPAELPLEKPVAAMTDAFAETVTESSSAENKPGAKPRAPRKAVSAKLATSSTPREIATSSNQLSETKTPATSPSKKTSVKNAPGSLTKKAAPSRKGDLDVTSEIAAKEPKVEISPIFKALADVSLPELEKEDRARLLMQSPTRLYFYWSVRENPWQQLRNIFGDDLGSYTLVLKLIDLRSDTEQIHPCDDAGNWWFDVEPDGEYQAEIGFYAVNRPYFRVIYSNTIATPRRSPSPRPASEARWTVSANKFAEVLDVAGFSRDAFDVAMAGDDHVAAQDTTHAAFMGFIGTNDHKLDGISSEDIRYAMLALASGLTLEELRFRVSPALFAILQANAGNLVAEKAMSALREHFDIDEGEWHEEEIGPAVFGASLVNFPRTLKTKKGPRISGPALAPRYNPVSSHNLR